VTTADPRLLALGGLVTRFSLDITAVVDRALGTEFISNIEAGVLATLSIEGPMSGKALAEDLGVSRRAIASVVRRLESSQLVVSSAHPDDARAVQVTLTRRGHARVRRLSQALATFFINLKPLAQQVVEILPGGDGAPTSGVLSPVELVRLAASTGIELDAAVNLRVQGRGPLGRQRLALLRICAVGEGRAGELAEYLDLSSGGLTYVVDRLVEEGLVERSYGASADRRAVVHRTTAAGRRRAALVLAGYADRGPELRRLFLEIASMAETERSA
jgi:DNA-binding MarR family transcriptional regulator